MALPVIAAAAAPIVGGIVGKLFGGPDREKADALMKEAYAEIDAIGAPPDLSREIIRQKFEQAGMLSPEVEQAIDVGVSKVAEIQEDPTGRQIQMRALGQLTQRMGGGLTMEDRAAYNQLRQNAQRDLEAKRQQIVQNMQSRGLSGSGAELQAALLSSQASADEQAAEGDRLAAQASQNALQAAMQGGQMASQLRGQDFDVSKTKAAAADELNRFSVQSQMDRQTRAVNSRNAAQEYNLAQKQRVMDANVLQDNEEKLRQNQEKGRLWDRQLAQAQAKAGNKQAQAAAELGKAAETQQMWSGIGSAVGSGIAGVSQYNQNQDLLDRLYPKSGSTHVPPTGYR